MTDEYETMTVPELKDLLRERGLKVGGNKSELIARLLDNEDSDDSEPTPVVSDVEVEEFDDDFDDEFDEDDDFFEDDDWDNI
ncbi:MAG: SAP domain-containing protein, partial [Candidatus Thermoplasmatota archaeon]|nr:SAP domain-containing protein [Candidatus Thermoplasmatota archaeon]